MWQYLGNGQWKNGDTITQAPPPMQTPFWFKGSNGAWDNTTYMGPESVAALPTEPINTTLPRQSGTTPPAPRPNLPYQVRVPGLTGGTGTQAPVVPPPAAPYTPPIAPGMPPAALPDPAAITDGRISGTYFDDYESKAPKGYNPELWAQRFAGPPAMDSGPVRNFSGQMGHPITPHVVDNPLATYINNDMRMPVKGPTLPNNIGAQLAASIAEVAKYGILGTDAGKERAQFVQNALENQDVLMRLAMKTPGVFQKGNSPTNPIDIAGALYDSMQAIKTGSNRRTPDVEPDIPVPPEEEDPVWDGDPPNPVTARKTPGRAANMDRREARRFAGGTMNTYRPPVKAMPAPPMTTTVYTPPFAPRPQVPAVIDYGSGMAPRPSARPGTITSPSYDLPTGWQEYPSLRPPVMAPPDRAARDTMNTYPDPPIYVPRPPVMSMPAPPMTTTVYTPPFAPRDPSPRHVPGGGQVYRPPQQSGPVRAEAMKYRGYGAQSAPFR